MSYFCALLKSSHRNWLQATYWLQGQVLACVLMIVLAEICNRQNLDFFFVLRTSFHTNKPKRVGLPRRYGPTETGLCGCPKTSSLVLQLPSRNRTDLVSYCCVFSGDLATGCGSTVSCRLRTTWKTVSSLSLSAQTRSLGKSCSFHTKCRQSVYLSETTFHIL